MSQRESILLWLKDILEQLATRRQELEWARDGETMVVLTQSMIRDLDRCRQLCGELQRRAQSQRAA